MINVLWLIPFGLIVFAVGWTVGGFRVEREQWRHEESRHLNCGCPNDGRAQVGCMRCDRWTCEAHSSRHPHAGEDRTGG